MAWYKCIKICVGYRKSEILSYLYFSANIHVSVPETVVNAEKMSGGGSEKTKTNLIWILRCIYSTFEKTGPIFFFVGGSTPKTLPCFLHCCLSIFLYILIVVIRNRYCNNRMKIITWQVIYHPGLHRRH